MNKNSNKGLKIALMVVIMLLVSSYTLIFIFASPGSLSGYVTNIEGYTYLSGVNVSVYNATNGSLVATNITNSNGYYIFPSITDYDNYTVSFNLINFTTRNISINITGSTALNTSLYQDGYGSYNVTVLDAWNNRPIPNANVNITWGSMSRSRATDSNGVVIIEVPGNTSSSWPVHTFRVSANGYISNNSVTGTVYEGTNENVTITLTGGCELKGYAKDAYRFSSPEIPSAYLELWDDDNAYKLNWSDSYFYNTTSNANGYYSINVPLTLFINITNCDPYVHASATGYLDNNNTQADGASPSAGFNISLTGSAIVNGSVMDINNKSYGIPNANITLWDNGSITYQINTSSAGIFSIPVKDGENHTLQISKNGYNAYSNITVFSTSIDYGQINITGNELLTGTVVDYQNTTIEISSATVTITPQTTGASYNTTTDSSGVFSINISGALGYDIVFTKNGYENNNSISIIAYSGTKNIGQVTLKGLNNIHGYVSDPINLQGTTADNVSIRITSNTNSNVYSNIYTSSNGYYSAYIPSTINNYTVRFDKGGYNITDINSFDTINAEINATLDGATRVSGTITDVHNSDPIESALIEFFNPVDNIKYYSTTSDADGSYSIDLGVNFNWSFNTSKSGYQTQTNGDFPWDSERNGNYDRVADVALNGTSNIHIRTVDNFNTSLALNNSVICILSEESSFSSCKYTKTTDSNGTADFNIQGGYRYYIKIERTGYLQKILSNSGQGYIGDFYDDNVTLIAHAGIYVYDRYAFAQKSIPHATVATYTFSNQTNFSYTLNETVVNITATCNDTQKNGLNVSLSGTTPLYSFYRSNATTGGETNVTFYRVPTGSHNLTIDGSSVGCGIYSTTINIPAGGVTYNFSYNVDVTQLIARVVDPRNISIESANVSSVTNSSVNCTTNTNGECTLSYMPGGTQNVSVNATSYYITNKTYTVNPGEINNKTNDPVIMDPMPGNLSIYVINTSGGISNVNVTISNSTFTNSTTTTSGWANFTGLISFYNITVNGTQQGYNYTTVQNTYVLPDNTTVVNVTLSENYLLVTVTDGDVIENANVTLWNITSGGIAQNGQGDSLTNLTNSSGMVIFHLLIPGTYNLTANKTGFTLFYENYSVSYGENTKTIVLNDTQAPTYSSQSQSNSTPNEGGSVTVQAYWEDDTILDDAWLSTNKSGSWVNETPISIPTGWSTFEISTLGYGNTTIGWRIYAKDTAGNENVTGIMSFFVTDVIAPTITFVSPTPDNNTKIETRTWVFINITTSETADTAILNWGGINVSMDGSGINWYKNRTNLDGSYTYIVYANDSFGNMRITAARVVEVNATSNLTVEVVDISENPLNNINVTVKSDTLGYNESKDTTQGSAKFTGLENKTYNITADGSLQGYGINQTFITLDWGENVKRLTLSVTTLTVNVTDSVGNPITGATVTVWNDSNGTNVAYYVTNDGLVPATGLTNNGLITFTRLLPCTNCNITVSKSGYVPAYNSTLVNITAGSSQTVQIDPYIPNFFTDTYTLNFTINNLDSNADNINISVRNNDTGEIVNSSLTVNGNALISGIPSASYDFIINGSSIAGFSDLIVYRISIGKVIMSNGTTDENGLVTLDVEGISNYYVRVSVSGYFVYDDMDNNTVRNGSYDDESGGVNPNINIPLTGGVSIQGYAHDVNFVNPVALSYEPVNNTVIDIYTTYDCTSGSLRYRAVTIENGTYNISISPVQRSDPQVNAIFCVKATANGFENYLEENIADFTFNSTETKNIGLTGSTNVNGWVRDKATNWSISGATVQLRSNKCYNSSANCLAYETTSDSSGRFSFKVNPTSEPINYTPYTIVINASNYMPNETLITTLPSEDQIYYLTTLGGSYLGVNVTSSLGELITDIVTVTYDGDVLTVPPCTLNNNELFCSGVPSGTRELIVNGSSQGYGIYTNSITIAQGDTLRLNITLNITELNITLLSDDTGSYINGMLVTLNNSQTFQNTTVNGSVLFTKVPAGSYNITFSGNNTHIYFYNNTNTAILTVNDSMAGILNNITYTFNETRALVNVTNSSSLGVSGLNITLTHNITGQTVQNNTNATGLALFPSIIYGNYTLSFNETQLYELGFIPVNQTVEIIPGEDEGTNNSFAIMLNDTQILFNATNSSGQLENVTITLLLNSSIARNGYNQTLNGTTNSSGILVLRNVIPTAYANGDYTYDIDANSTGYGTWRNNPIIVNVTNNTVTINLSRLSLIINVYNSSDVVDEPVNISLMSDSSVAQNTSGDYLNVTNVTNVTFTSLYVDNYTINVTSSKYFSQTINFTTENITDASQTVNITLVERTLYINVRNPSDNVLEEGVNISLVNETGDPVNGTNGTVIPDRIDINDSTSFEYVPDGTFVINITSGKYFSFNWTFNTTELADINYTKNFTMHDRTITVYIKRYNDSQNITDNTTVSILNSTGVAQNTTGDYLNGTTNTSIISLYGIPDGIYNISVNSSNYYPSNQTLDTLDSSSSFNFTFYLKRIGIGYFNVTVENSTGTKIDGATVTLVYNGTNINISGTTDPNGNAVLSVNTTLYNQSLNLTATKTLYSTNTSGPYSITAGEVKNITIIINRTECTDGTSYGSCSSSKPLYCSSSWELISDCNTCDCPGGQSCNTGTGTCYTPSGNGGNGGGGGGGGGAGCTEDWTCPDWSSCENGIKTRTCTDQNSCGTTSNKPDESQECVVEMELTLNPITINAGYCDSGSLLIKNTGDEYLLNVDIPVDELTIPDCCSLTSTESIASLSPGTSKTITLQVCASKTAAKGNYSYSLRVSSDKITRTIRSYVYISKNYMEILLDQILEINSSLNRLNIEELDILQRDYYNLARQSLQDARSYTLINNFDLAEQSIEDARNYLTKIEEYAKPYEFNWLLLIVIIIPAGVAFVLILRRTVFRKGVYEYKPPKYYPTAAKPKASVISEEGKRLLLGQIDKLNERISSIDTGKLNYIEMHYHNLAKDALDDVKIHILGDNVVAAKQALTDAHSHIKMLEGKV